MECCHPSRFGASNARYEQTCRIHPVSANIDWFLSRWCGSKFNSEDVMSLRGVMIGSLFIAGVWLPSCLELETTNGGGGTAGSSASSSGDIDACGATTTTCDACTSCASQGPSGACYDEVQACEQETPCNLVATCVAACGNMDPNCLETCWSTYPLGAAKYQAIYTCLCTTCIGLCACAG